MFKKNSPRGLPRIYMQQKDVDSMFGYDPEVLAKANKWFQGNKSTAQDFIHGAIKYGGLKFKPNCVILVGGIKRECWQYKLSREEVFIVYPSGSIFIKHPMRVKYVS